MIGRIVLGLCLLALPICLTQGVHAQDVPGIEICTAERTMERRTSCLQSNVEFLQKTVAKLGLDHQQKLDAANRQIDALKAAVVALQKVVDDLKTAQAKPADSGKTDNGKKVDPAPAKATTKDGVK
jgi:hypothetical protein